MYPGRAATDLQQFSQFSAQILPDFERPQAYARAAFSAKNNGLAFPAARAAIAGGYSHIL
jgi:hypothetical protein